MKAAWSDTGSVALIENGGTAWLDSGAIYMEAVPAGGSARKTWDGLAKASIKTWDGLADASVKTWNGLA